MLGFLLQQNINVHTLFQIPTDNRSVVDRIEKIDLLVIFGNISWSKLSGMILNINIKILRCMTFLDESRLGRLLKN